MLSSGTRHSEPWPFADRGECGRIVVTCKSIHRACCFVGAWVFLFGERYHSTVSEARKDRRNSWIARTTGEFQGSVRRSFPLEQGLHSGRSACSISTTTIVTLSKLALLTDSLQPAGHPLSCQQTLANSSHYQAAVVCLRLRARQAPPAVRLSSRTPSYQQPWLTVWGSRALPPAHSWTIAMQSAFLSWDQNGFLFTGRGRFCE